MVEGRSAGLSAATIQEGGGIAGSARDQRPVSGRRLATSVGRLAAGSFASNQQLAQHMKISPQHAQANVACKSPFGPVATALQPIARLQGPDRRLDARVRLPGFAELDACRLLLLGRLVDSAHRQTRMFDDLGKFLLVVRAVKSSVEGRAANPPSVTSLGLASLLDHHVAIALIAWQNVIVRDEACSVLVKQYQASELHRLSRLASLVHLRVRLEDAEQLLAVGNRFAVKHASPRRAADVPRPLQKGVEFVVQRQGLRVGDAPLFQRFAERIGPSANDLRQLQQFAVRPFQSLSATVPFAGGDPFDLPAQLFRLSVEVFVLPPAAHARQSREHRRQADNLAQAVADHAIVRGEMDIGLRHEGVSPYGPGRLRLQAMSLLDEGLIDLRDRLGAQQVHVAGDPPPVEFLFVLLLAFPASDSHDLAQGPMVLGEILELVVVVVAAQAYRRQHQDFPVAHAGPAVAWAGPPVDIAGDCPENGITYCRPAIDVLQGAENGNRLVAAVEVQNDPGNRRTIQTLLTIKRFSHRLCSSKIWTCRAGFDETMRLWAQT